MLFSYFSVSKALAEKYIAFSGLPYPESKTYSANNSSYGLCILYCEKSQK
jgi:hypothetical protein